MPLTELPLGLPGRVFGSQMPHHALYDRQGALLADYAAEGVSLVVLLASDKECLAKAGRVLREDYLARGWQVIDLATEDFQPLATLGNAASEATLTAALEQVEAAAREGRNAAIHCSAGIGRTGTFAALLRRCTSDCSGQEAIAWVRQFITGAVETDAQRRLVQELAVDR